MTHGEAQPINFCNEYTLSELSCSQLPPLRPDTGFEWCNAVVPLPRQVEGTRRQRGGRHSVLKVAKREGVCFFRELEILKATSERY